MDVERKRRPTSADVAREAGLSRATVSYVLNRTPNQSIPEETRRRVVEAAERLRYAPSAAARELRTGRSTVVLCLLPDWPLGPAVGGLLEHLSNALADRGLTLVAHPRAGSTRPVSEVWRTMTPAAVLAFEPVADADLTALRAAGIELAIVLLSASQGRDGAAVTVAEQRQGRLQVEHLAAVGHRQLGYAFPADDRLLGFARPRLDGARQACAELGLDEPQVATVPLDGAAAAVAVSAWRATEPRVTGVCAYNDEVAFAVLAGAHRVGLAVPDDLAVIGVDDVPTARVAIPSLTTVATDQVRLAGYLTEVVTSRITGDPEPARPGSDILSVIRRDSA